MECNKDNCLHCEYEECLLDNNEQDPKRHLREYQAQYREKNREKLRDFHKNWRRAHKDEINKRVRENVLLKKKCAYCKAELKGRHTAQKCGRHYFCTNECLSEYLLQKSIESGSVKTIIMPQPRKGGEDNR